MPSPVRIACFGDSLTEGYGLAPDEALPVVLERMLADEGIAARCLNFGVSGDTSADGLARLGAVLDAAPDAAIVAFGANDCFMDEPVDAVTATLSAILDAFAERNVPVLLVGITALLNPDEKYRAGFDSLFPELAERYDLDLFPDVLAPYFGNNDLTLMDGMHPNAQGVEAMARAMLDQVVKLAKKGGA
jgi:acyl-CoA thioesterase-1